MKYTSLILAASLAWTASASETSSIDVTISNIKASSGQIKFALFRGQENYDNNSSPALALTFPVDGDSLHIPLTDLPAGEYAIRVMHDENNNGKLDTNLLGMPTEQYGFSNNAGQFGPASFADARFNPAELTEMQIRLR
ncbi:DUF2141 domain-containing protein [Alkalimonas collagenimarina]|uniref:DUF2141 domain-containing protein n=1 Tax=Alkalimonas collagenimarina TaxID=400390 RepID=A0ABT9GY04_9GAMM|nr:DUF2141 domain-containing protein [Alkalimonas collagenimarina]MDP4535942.1 DUF2141 domain-containing protein [Alkalimonas collagenimarina]